MNILLSYSKRHFDPTRPQEEHEHWGSSASILARSLYAELSKLGDVTYIDAFNDEYLSVKRQNFDLFVGIYSNFEAIAGRFNIEKTVFFAVNMHPAERNHLLQDFVARAKLSQEAYAPWDIADTKGIKRALSRADIIVCVGNTAVYNSYIKHGISKSKIKMLNYSVGPLYKSSNLKLQPQSLVYVASEIGLRKGFDILFDIFTNKQISQQKFKLTIIGTPSTPYYEAKLKKLKDKLGNKLIIKGWIDSSSPQYTKVLEEAGFILFPSLEEGQAGTVLDAIRHGVVPITTSASGVDFAPLGFLASELESSLNKQIVLDALSKDPESLSDLKKKTQDYYQLFHNNNDTVFEDLLKGVLANELYPKISVILPIFNKEKVIIPLIKKLNKACQSYHNIEVKIIFDGCVDKTEEVVRKYFANHQVSYDVEFFVTPNIFEVKSNNIGLKAACGKYCAIIQDDIFINDPDTFLEAISFLEKADDIVILGCLAGVNYYPRGTKGLRGSGQIAQTEHEVYWRQDEATDPSLKKKFFEVDACMRGPLIIRKGFLEKHGYLDEEYAPLYQDDMDIAFRARKFGYRVFCGLFDVVNKSWTMANYDENKNKFFEDVIRRNTDIFYSRWTPTKDKNYIWINRSPLYNKPLNRFKRRAKNKIDSTHPMSGLISSLRPYKSRLQLLSNTISNRRSK